MADVLHAQEFRLAYSECDPAGIVYYATYYPWMERTHTEWTFLNDAPTNRHQEMWGASAVARASSCEYLRAAKLFDPLRCEMRLTGLGRTSFQLRFDFLRLTDGALMCEGQITLVFVDGSGRAAPVPEPMRALLLSAGEPLGS
jgi:YbgC/YbaW family acyl-CoA thioester hydrolase